MLIDCLYVCVLYCKTDSKTDCKEKWDKRGAKVNMIICIYIKYLYIYNYYTSPLPPPVPYSARRDFFRLTRANRGGRGG